MQNSERMIEASGESVKAAVEQGLAELGVAREQVDVEVLDAGSEGFLGLGGRDATVRLVLLGIEADEPVEEEVIPTTERVARETPAESEPVDAAEEAEVAIKIVGELLSLMQIDARIELGHTEEDDITGRSLPILSVTGDDDMGALIGPRGETLNSLQFLSRIMVGNKLHRRPSFVIDVAGYRDRREAALTKLADRTAAKAIQQGRAITLEAMPPNERRIIHVALRDNDQVVTESAGEGSGRRVRIFPVS